MDADWFKALHARSGVNQRLAAQRMGKAGPFFTRVYSGQQKLKLHEAQLLAEILGAPLAEVLSRAGLSGANVASDLPTAPRVDPRHTPDEAIRQNSAEPLASILNIKPQGAQSIWRLKTDAMRPAGYLPNDILLIDPDRDPRPGDAVLAQRLGWDGAETRSFLRIWRPPYLTRPNDSGEPPLVADGQTVVISGVVTAMARHVINR